MNAIINPKDKVTKLSRSEMRTIVFCAVRPSDPLPVRTEQLKSLSFCTDDVKFQVLKSSSRVSEDLYDCLFRMYFGVSDTDSEQEEKPQTQTAETAAEDEPPQEQTQEPATETEQKTALEQLAALEGTEVFTEVFEPKKKRGQAKTVWTDEAVEPLISGYNKGMTYAELATKLNITEAAAANKVSKLKKDKQYKEMFITMSRITKTPAAANTLTVEEVTGTALPPISGSESTFSPKTFTAIGTGFLTTDGGLKLNEEPITSMLRQKIVEEGIVQFYAEVEIRIRPVEPVGMVVSVEG